MKFIDFNSVAESLANYVEDLKLTKTGDVYALECENNTENWTNLKDWLYEISDEDSNTIKITYENNQIKLTLS